MTINTPLLTVFWGFMGLFLLFFPISATSAEATVKVIGITDGDTVRVLFQGENRQEKVRLDQIDAPERGQPFGEKSRQYLAELVHGKTITLEYTGRDRYGRLIGTLRVDGKSMNAEMVRAGYAWVYRRYMKDENLLLLEAAARENERGLWADPQPIAPREWRRGYRQPAPTPAGAASANDKCRPDVRCSALRDCAAAQFQLRQCAANRLDGDGDGIPCEALCR